MDCIWLILLLACCGGGCHIGSGCKELGARCSHGGAGRCCDDGAVPMPIFAPQPCGARECGSDHARKPVCCDTENDCGRSECREHAHENCGRHECCERECCGHEHESCGRVTCCEHEQAGDCGCDHTCSCE